MGPTDREQSEQALYLRRPPRADVLLSACNSRVTLGRWLLENRPIQISFSSFLNFREMLEFVHGIGRFQIAEQAANSSRRNYT